MAPPSRNLLACIIIFMKTVVLYEDENKMHDQNISLMFAPNLFRQKDTEALIEMQYLGIKTDLCKLMMKRHKEVFGAQLIKCLDRNYEKLRAEKHLEIDAKIQALSD